METKTKNKTVSVKIDGREYKVPEAGDTAADFIRLVGLDPNRYDLVQMNPHGESHRFGDNDQMAPKSGDKYVTVRQSAPVA